MEISMNELLCCISTALDIVEGDLLGASTNHGKRIAILSAQMGRYLQLPDEELIVLSSGALLHDNALTEYILSERPGKDQDINMLLHCVLGQRNASSLPFPGDFDGCVLYHHERADGKGPFAKKEGEFPRSAALVAVADNIDANHHLQFRSPEDLPMLHKIIREETGAAYTKEGADALLAVLDEKMLFALRDENVEATFYQTVPRWDVEIQDDAIIRLAGITVQIVDYKSCYTRKHSVLVANTCWWISGLYNLDDELRAQIYLAAALHDLGKLSVTTEILEKTGDLNDDEFAAIKEHSVLADTLLRPVKGLENICGWVVNHHEKLNGTGYPSAKKGDELDFISRLLACVDIYHAVSEERPYHPARSHFETMPILYDMASKGELDEDIVRQLDDKMRKFPEGVVPSPPNAIAHL